MVPFTFEYELPLTKYKEFKIKERLWSNIYSTPQYLPLKFNLRVFSHGGDEKNSEYISYFLFCKPPNNQTIVLKYHLYIQDETGKMIAQATSQGDFNQKFSVWGNPRFCRRLIITPGSDDFRYFTFGCKVEVKDFNPNIFFVVDDKKGKEVDPEPDTIAENFDGTCKEKEQKDKDSEFGKIENVPITVSKAVAAKEPETNYLLKLGLKIAALYPTMEISDVSFHVTGVEIKAHKLILSVHSQRLAEIIKENESNSNTIEIEGFDPTVVQKFLEFIYTGNIVAIDQLEISQIMNIFHFATIYSISDLKEYMKNQIISSISVLNVCEIANHSSMNNEYDIHKIAIDYIAKTFMDVKNSGTFAQLSAENAKEVLLML